MANVIETDDATDGPAAAEGARTDASLHVDMISTPDDGSCGIGTYAGDLAGAFDDASVHLLPIDQSAQSVGHFLSLALRAARSDSDVIHVQHEYGLFRRDGSPWPGILGLVLFPALLVLASLTNKAVVTTFHSVLNPDQEEAPFRRRAYLYAMHRLVATTSDHVIFLSEDCQDAFLTDIDLPSDRYSLLSHGANVEQATSMDPADAKELFGYAPDDVVVMIPGYMRPPKGHDVFVEVADRLPGYEFLIAGGARPAGVDHDFAEAVRADAPENVQVTGVLDDETFNAAFEAADLAVLPYRVVTQSGTFNWCAAHGVPAITSDQPYFRRIAGQWGCLETHPVDDVPGLAEHVRSVLTTPERREQLREGMLRYRETNAFEKVAGRHGALYERLVSEKTGSPAVAAGSSNRSEEVGA